MTKNSHNDWLKVYEELDAQYGATLEQSVEQIAKHIVDSVDAADQIAPTVGKMVGEEINLVALFHVIIMEKDKGFPQSTRHLIAHASSLECYLLTRVIRRAESLMPEFPDYVRATACLLFGIRLVHETVTLFDQLPYHTEEENPEKEHYMAVEELTSIRSKYTDDKVAALPDHIRIPFVEFLNKVDESISL
jgi:hypothetical protein